MTRHSHGITGKKFGKLTAIESLEVNEDRKNFTTALWKFQCDCENYKAVNMNQVIYNKGIRSCGCSSGSNRRIDEDLRTKSGKNYLTSVLSEIKKRCFKTHHKDYKYYGARGISLYPQWIESTRAFINYILSNLGKRPEGHTLDRINNNLGYIPGNLRWATRSEQNRNKRPSNTTKSTAIEQYTLTGEYVQTFKSISLAAKSITSKIISGHRLAIITRSNNNQTRGYLWKMAPSLVKEKTEDLATSITKKQLELNLCAA